MSVNNQLKHGVFWTTVERFSAQGIQFILSIVIARLLVPEDYGLIAMISIFIGLSQCLIDSGFVDALVQKKDKSDVDYSTAFYFNVGLGGIIFIVLFVAAPFIAVFYNQPALTDITRVMGTLPLITSLRLAVKAKMLVNLQFKELAVASIISVVISGTVGLWMAYTGYGVWALVSQTVLNYVSNAILMWLYAKWSPSFVFSIESLKHLWNFGSKLLLSSIMDTLYSNIYALLIGKRYSSADAGLFNRSQNLAMFPALNISTIIVKAFYPIECKIQDNKDELRRVFLSSIRIACFVTFPLLIGLAALAEPFILLLLKEKWIAAVPLLRILAVSYMFNPLMLLNTSILSVNGRTNLLLKAEFIKKAVGLVIVFGLLPFGLKTLCFGYVLYSIADIIIVTFFVKKTMGISLMDELKEIMPTFFISVTMGGAVFIISLLMQNIWIQLIAGIVSGILFYGLATCIFKLKEFNLVLSFIKKS